MATFPYEPRTTVPSVKDEEIQVQGDCDLTQDHKPKVFLASALSRLTFTLLAVRPTYKQTPKGSAKSVGSWRVTQQLPVDWDRLIPLLPQSLPLGEA